ncbi:MAG TPA: purine-nucleoside phosphorylase [Anaerolineae bacterium]|nr:purine-nucleoside phosphorylase [Anaerolineae bacterium]
MTQNTPILEFDPTREAVYEPQMERVAGGLNAHCVLCFFPEVLAKLAADGILKLATTMYSEMSPNPVYTLTVGTQQVTVTHPGVGAPLAAFYLEILIAFGCDKFVAVGGAGALRSDLSLGHLVVPNSAVRDEGTSYHYLPPSREVAGSPDAIIAIVQTLTQKAVPYVVGKTWTTDGIFRETRPKVTRRQAEGCLTVEMETATFFAIAQFRNVAFGQILYCGDDLTGKEWDSRDWVNQTPMREKLFWLAVESCLAI